MSWTTNDQADKISGFIINKVFRDPSFVAQQGAVSFGGPHQGTVPFDFAAMREFFRGDVPSIASVFGTQVWAALAKAFDSPRTPIPEPFEEAMKDKEFSSITVASPESQRGGLAIAVAMILVGAFTLTQYWDFFRYFDSFAVAVLVSTVLILGLVGTIEPTRRFIGRLVDTYVGFVKRVFLRVQDE